MTFDCRPFQVRVQSSAPKKLPYVATSARNQVRNITAYPPSRGRTEPERAWQCSAYSCQRANRALVCADEPGMRARISSGHASVLLGRGVKALRPGSHIRPRTTFCSAGAIQPPTPEIELLLRIDSNGINGLYNVFHLKRLHRRFSLLL